MTPEQRKAALKERGITQKMIADKLRLSEMSVSRQINNTANVNVSDRIMTAVAEALGKPKEAVFPEYYFGPKRRITSKAIGEPTMRRKRQSNC